MTWFRSRLLGGSLVLLAVLIPACQANTSNVPDGSMLSCTTNAECPRGTFCNSSGRCVPADKEHTEQPSLMPPVVEPSIGTKATPFKIKLTSTKPLQVLPDVRLELPQRSPSDGTVVAPFTPVDGCTMDSSTQYTCTYTAKGTENDGQGGAIAFDVTLTDTDQNVVPVPKAGAIQLDFQAPSLAFASVSPQLPAKVGNRGNIHIFFTPSEEIDTTRDIWVVPSQTLSGNVKQLLAKNVPGTSNYQVDYTLHGDGKVGAPDEATGDLSFTVALTDKAGNVTDPPLTIGTVSIDQLVPVISPLQPQKSRYSTQDGFKQVQLDFDVAKSVRWPQELTATIAGNSFDSCTPAADNPLHYTCLYNITGAEPPGAASIVVTTLDAAENTDSQWATVFFDFTPVSIMGSVAPSAAKAGDVPVLSVSATKPLPQAPALQVLKDGQPTNALGPVVPAGSGTGWTFSFPAIPLDVKDTFELNVVATDDVGYQSMPGSASLSVDTVTPVLTNVQTTDGQGHAATRFSTVDKYNTIELTFDSSKPVVAPTATLGALCPATPSPVPCAFTCTVSGTNSATCTYQVTGKELTSDRVAINTLTEASLPVSVTAQDGAGNTGASGSTITLDFQSPKLLSQRVSAATIGVGQTESVEVSVNERVQPSPSLVTGGAGDLAFPLASGTTFTFQHTIQPSDPTGHYTTSVSLVDLVGNAATLAGPEFDVDTNVPTIGTISTNATRFSSVAPYNQVQLTVQMNKSLDVAPSSLSVTLDGSCPAAASGKCSFVCGAYDSAAHQYTCSYQVTGNELTADGKPIGALAEASLPILISATDEAGNEAYDSNTVVVLDFAPPTLISQSATPADAGVGQVEAIILSASETLSQAPTVVVSGASEVLPFQWVAQTAYTFTDTIQGSDSAGAYSSLVTLTDSVGNQATAAGPSFQIDTVVPKITNVKTDASTYSEVAGHNLVKLTFDVAKNVGSGLVVTLGGRPMNCGSFQATSPSYTCTFAVSKTTSSAGPQSIVIQTLDAAGNTDSHVTTVAFDFTALTLTVGMAPNPSKANDVPVLTITASKPLTNAPTVSVAPNGTVYGSLGSGGQATGAGTSWTFLFAKAVPPLDGNFNITASAVDDVGHTTSQTTPFQVDAAIPQIANIATNLTRYSSQAAYNQVVLTFDSLKSGKSAPLTSLHASLGGQCLPGPAACQPFTCGAFQSTSPNYTCTYSVTKSETTATGVPITSLPEAALPVNIFGADAVGNQTSGTTSITLDFAPPVFVGAPMVTYLPGSTNALSKIPGATAAAATVGTDIRLMFTVNEPLGGKPTVSTTPSSTGLSFLETSGAGTSYIFDATIGSPPADASYVVSISATDLVGNSAPLTPTATAIVDTTPPSSPLVTAAGGPITYARMPWGSSTSGGTPLFQITSSSGAVNDPKVGYVLAYDSANDLLGTAQVSGTSFGTMQLSQADRVSVFVSGVDEAGNVSPAAPVHNVAWTAGFGGKQPGNTLTNPNILSTASDFLVAGTLSPFLGPLSQPTSESSEPPQSGAAAVTVHDGTGLASSIDPLVWQQRVTAASAVPVPRWGHGMVYDSARDRMVVFGGQNSAGLLLGDTWEWDGLQWTNVTPAGAVSPPARIYFAMAYDPIRGRTVLFGGQGANNVTLGDTWEWDGHSWMNVTPSSGSSPPARTSPGMVYDAGHGVMVMAGGYPYKDTWTWNGSTWTNVTPTSNSLPVRRYFALAYDAASSQVLFFGGNDALQGTYFNDLWAWNGSSWTQQSPAGTAPSQRSFPKMSYDSARQRAVLFGGASTSADLNDIWELTWSSASSTYTWNNVLPTGSTSAPSVRERGALAYDSIRGQTVTFGGWKTFGGFVWYNESWGWNGSTWTNLSASTTLPPARNYAPLAYDVGRGRTVLFGGSGVSAALNDTWEWLGNAWTQLAPASSPSPRYVHAMAYDASSRAVSVMFGGTNGTSLLNDTWTWNGTTWTNVTPASSPAARMGHVMAYDSGHGNTLLFGGCTAGAAYCSTVANDTWTWNGSAWTNVTPGGSPPARALGGLAYDSARGRVVLFGGCSFFSSYLSCSSYLNDTWEWNGSSWTNVTPAGSSPSARYGQALAFDSVRGKVVLYGGYNASGIASDVWEWDGTSWTQISATTQYPRSMHGMVYDSARSRVVAVGGLTTGSVQNSDTLELPSDPGRRAAVLGEFTFAAAGETSPVIQQITVDAFASGTGNTLVLPGDGVASPGATLAVWNGLTGGWVQVGANTSSSPTEIKYSTGSAAEAASFLFGTPQAIDVAVFPTTGRGNGLGPTQINVDLLELTVQYQH